MVRSVLMFAFRFEFVVCLRFEVCWVLVIVVPVFVWVYWLVLLVSAGLWACCFVAFGLELSFVVCCLNCLDLGYVVLLIASDWYVVWFISRC